MIKQVNKHIGFDYLLTEIQLYTLILLELNIFLKTYRIKSKINLPHATYLEYKIMILYVSILFYHFHRIYAWRKTLLDYTNLFSPNDYDYNDKIIHKFFNPNLSGWGVILLLPVGLPLITQKR